MVNYTKNPMFLSSGSRLRVFSSVVLGGGDLPLTKYGGLALLSGPNVGDADESSRWHLDFVGLGLLFFFLAVCSGGGFFLGLHDGGGGDSDLAVMGLGGDSFLVEMIFGSEEWRISLLGSCLLLVRGFAFIGAGSVFGSPVFLSTGGGGSGFCSGGGTRRGGGDVGCVSLQNGLKARVFSSWASLWILSLGLGLYFGFWTLFYLFYCYLSVLMDDLAPASSIV